MHIDEKKLRRMASGMNSEDRKSLLDYAEFLIDRRNRSIPAPTSPLAPEKIDRPAKESVPAAIKRLSRTYHMLDKSRYLGSVSEFMTKNLVAGLSAETVVDEIEEFFLARYKEYESEFDE